MIYTCYEMALDCRADKPQGWAHFISGYVPVIRKLLAHYADSDPQRLEHVLVAIRKPESSMFHSVDPAPERWFVAELRQKVLAELPDPEPSIDLDLETVAKALEPLTVVEKQATWIEGFRYSSAETGAMLRMAPDTVGKIRERAAEMLRGATDSWNRGVLAENGLRLGRAATAVRGADCLPTKAFLDVLDGRTTWSGRDQMVRHVTSCWHCIDHFCRMAEVIEVLRGTQPLTDEEAAPFRRLLGVGEPKRRGLFGFLAR